MANDDVIEMARVYISEPGTWYRMGGDTHRLVKDLRNHLTAANRRIGELEGAANADEIRLRQASETAGVGYFGCDTPEVMADTIGELRESIRSLRALVADLEKGHAILAKIHAVWTYPNRGSLGALLDEAAEYIEPGVFGAALSAEDGREMGGE